tara:strand:+ start:524 stop:1453 length:930 start_codon:yes stop_codon:yes gene_type:complete
MNFDSYEKLGLNKKLDREVIVNGRSNNEPRDTSGDVNYHPCLESYKQEGVLEGNLVYFKDWSETEIFGGTQRDISVYIPDTSNTKDLKLIVLQDGDSYKNENGPVRAISVFNNLLYQKRIDPFAAIFVMPGRPMGMKVNVPGEKRRPEAHRQRSVEYDSCDDRYLRFMKGELIPFVSDNLDLNISDDPSNRLLIGMSSGGICAFNAAWHDPDSFGNVISHCGSFTNIRGGHNYPSLIRNTERKQIKAFLQSGKEDLNNIYGNWPLANKQMASSLDYAGYDYRFEFGVGSHSLNHGGSLFAESITWIWNS